MDRFALDYVQCPNCSHVWNRSFSYDAIPYADSPNRMYNKGGIWSGHLAQTRDLVLSKLPLNPTVVDIGCGEGHFVRGLSDACNGKGRFVGFDPSATEETGLGIEFHATLFEPLTHIADVMPDAIVMRHVLEHLMDPTAFVEQLAWGASTLEKPVYFFAEVPCIDRVFETDRLADFFYEHPSQFSSQSFAQLMSAAGEIVALETGYDGEVVYALVHLGVDHKRTAATGQSHSFLERSSANCERIRRQLDDLASRGVSVAVWGGTGKAAAFMHQFGVDAARFPLVVDSDPDKAGTFVPGTGQEIVYRDVLKTKPIETLIIPTQWRAKDIIAEMGREGIVADTILIEHNGCLINFLKDDHPYR